MLRLEFKQVKNRDLQIYSGLNYSQGDPIQVWNLYLSLESVILFYNINWNAKFTHSDTNCSEIFINES